MRDTDNYIIEANEMEYKKTEIPGESSNDEAFGSTPGVHYYLFDANHTIVMVTGNEDRWYKRDRINHRWIEDDAWSVFFYDLGFDKIEIVYDENREKITARRNVPGYYSATIGSLFAFENDGEIHHEAAPEDVGANTLKSPESTEKAEIAKKTDWETSDMPEQHSEFTLHRALSETDVAVLRKGNIPHAMEDKWFWYCEGNTLYAHRSWTGFCIYVIQMNPGEYEHRVTVNRDPEQYMCTDNAEDEKRLNMLLNWWTRPKYDYYHEWLEETVAALKKSGQIQ